MNEIRSKGKLHICVRVCGWSWASYASPLQTTLSNTNKPNGNVKMFIVYVCASESLIVFSWCGPNTFTTPSTVSPKCSESHKHNHACKCARALSLLETQFILFHSSILFFFFFFHSCHHRMCTKISFYLFIIVISLGGLPSFCLLLYYSGKMCHLSDIDAFVSVFTRLITHA